MGHITKLFFDLVENFITHKLFTSYFTSDWFSGNIKKNLKFVSLIKKNLLLNWLTSKEKMTVSKLEFYFLVVLIKKVEFRKIIVRIRLYFNVCFELSPPLSGYGKVR